MKQRCIAVLAFPGISPFHLSIPCAIFGEDRSAANIPRFDLRLCAELAGATKTSTGFEIVVAHDLAGLDAADTIIIPGWADPQAQASPALIAALQAAHRRGVCLVGLCLGTFVLAAAGMLDGRRATTHWLCADQFARRYPRVRLDPDVLYVDDGDILTSAGAAAGIDCCLHLLRRWYGAEIANRVARRMVVSPHRQSGQAQFIELPLPTSPAGEQFSIVLDWALRHLDQPLSVDLLAEQAHMSRRTFTRRFRQATGNTVVDWLRHQRLALAQQLLESTDLSIEQIASRSGFGTTASLRQLFRENFRLSPASYRREFRGQAG
ncbi:MAG: helix-turn-helix domain-containing protein [Methylophilaceae bacterium]|jgi:transcriptional regulator GlxA family with amidase domain|nr:helix-turn-helix domain-containing protein [Methylophilaceae bacterium]